MYIYSRTRIGYLHIKEDKVCQDFSTSFKSNTKSIITCCDGHGGNIYIRSDKGAEYASRAIYNTFLSLSNRDFLMANNPDIAKRIKLLVLCEWNKLVEDDLANNPIKKKEIAKLDDKYKEKLLANNIKAYGTTLSGAMLYKDKALVISLGDTDVLSFKNAEIKDIFDTEEEPVANLTHSMCSDDAFEHLKVKLIDMKKIDGLLLCTDGFSGAYQTVDNFNKSFIKPVVNNLIKTNSTRFLDDLVDKIALEKGTGDDVSLAFFMNNKVIKKYYKKK